MIQCEHRRLVTVVCWPKDFYFQGLVCKILLFLFITHVANVYNEFNACQIEFDRRDILFEIR